MDMAVKSPAACADAEMVCLPSTRVLRALLDWRTLGSATAAIACGMDLPAR